MPKGKGGGYGSKTGGEPMSYSHGTNKKLMGHDSKPYHINAFKAQKRDMGRIRDRPMSYRGTPDQAFDYKY